MGPAGKKSRTQICRLGQNYKHLESCGEGRTGLEEEIGKNNRDLEGNILIIIV